MKDRAHSLVSNEGSKIYIYIYTFEVIWKHGELLLKLTQKIHEKKCNLLLYFLHLMLEELGKLQRSG